MIHPMFSIDDEESILLVLFLKCICSPIRQAEECENQLLLAIFFLDLFVRIGQFSNLRRKEPSHYFVIMASSLYKSSLNWSRPHLYESSRDEFDKLNTKSWSAIPIPACRHVRYKCSIRMGPKLELHNQDTRTVSRFKTRCGEYCRQTLQEHSGVFRGIDILYLDLKRMSHV